jgi:hypothetical protein
MGFREIGGVCVLNSSGSRLGPTARSYEYGNELTVSVKDGEIFD